jgi:hypothetical protein
MLLRKREHRTPRLGRLQGGHALLHRHQQDETAACFQRALYPELRDRGRERGRVACRPIAARIFRHATTP